MSLTRISNRLCSTRANAERENVKTRLGNRETGGGKVESRESFMMQMFSKMKSPEEERD